MFLPSYWVMTAQEWERITLLIVSPEDFDKLSRTRGGHWHAVVDGDFESASTRSSSQSIWGFHYNFRTYRRD